MAGLAQADSSEIIGDESLRRIENTHTTQTKRSKTNLETVVKFLPRPRQQGPPLVDHWLRPKPAKTAHFVAGADSETRSPLSGDCCTPIFVDFEVFQRNRSAAYPAVWDSYRRHTSLQCVLAQETVAQNGQAERCVICQL
jgi:hypothetical protein